MVKLTNSSTSTKQLVIFQIGSYLVGNRKNLESEKSHIYFSLLDMFGNKIKQDLKLIFTLIIC